MEFENIGGNCISVISEYIPDYISFALISRQFRDSWVNEKKTSRKLLQGYVKNGNLDMVKFYIKNGCPRRWKKHHLQQIMDIWKYLNGQDQKGVGGMN